MPDNTVVTTVDELRKWVGKETGVSDWLLITQDRVNAFADYRDRLHLLGTAAWRDARITSRAMRLTSDELAADNCFFATAPLHHNHRVVQECRSGRRRR